MRASSSSLWHCPGVRTLLLVLSIFAAACHHDPKPVNPADMPPLPPSSGTPIGYLLDAATDLKLDDTQVGKLRDLDQSLAARDADIDVQLRSLERPEQEEETPKGQKPKRHNNAPGVGVRSSADAGKLHETRARNDRDALAKAFVVLDPNQQSAARKLLEDRGVQAPGSTAKPQPGGSEDDGQPLPGDPQEP